MKYLPIFVNLHNQPVLVIGGGQVAFRKITLLIESGAKINVISKNICPELELLFFQNKITWLKGVSFNKKYLKKIFLLIIATDNDSLNHTISSEARKRFILTNVVDDKPKCSFIFPSIVNRSPLLIAVSSNGLAPVLSKLIREKLESLLPKKIGIAVKIAGQWREKIKHYFPNVEQRRLFWQKLFASTFINQIISNNIENAEKILKKQIIETKKIRGEVILLGAGPGDPGLMTLRGLQVMQTADIILYDSLVSKEILDLARRDSIKICVGKRAGKISITQEKINHMMIKFAKKNQQVIRLKGGDPFIFGRGGEEIEAINDAGILFQVIPGITAAIASSAYSGIPLTHRDYSSSILLITGKYFNRVSKKFLKSISNIRQTLVIYMGTLQIKIIKKKLLFNGFKKDVPVAIISCATTKNQKIFFGNLENIIEIANKVISPSIIILGKVVNLKNKLAWFNHFNKKSKTFFKNI